MSDVSIVDEDIRSLVAEGNAALLAGDAYGARQRFRQALERDPQRVEALIGLAGSLRPFREKREYLLRALAIAPEHPEARAALAHVEARLAAGEILAPGGVQTRPSTGDQPGAGLASPLATAPQPTPAVLHCYVHPERETGLRCTNCDRPICGDCARPAAVGQLCPECVKARRPVNYQVSGVNMLVAGVTSLIYSVFVTFLASLLFGQIGFFGFIVALLLGPVAGDLLVRLADKFTRNKRGRSLQLAVGICYVLGALPWTLLITLVAALPLGLMIFTIAAAATAVTRLR